MNRSEILDLVKVGEGYTLEFKESYTDTIGKTICAFANSSGGKIILGVKDNGEVKGYNLTNAVHSKIQDVARHIDPSITVLVEKIDSQLTIITVPEGEDKPYAHSGQYYIRIGATSQKMNRNELRRFFQNERQVLFDEKPNFNFNLDNDFNKPVYESFLNKANITNNLPQLDLLRNLSLLDGKNLKNAGVLVFCHRVTKFFMNARITCILYKGKNKLDILDKKDFDADLYANFDNAFDYICSRLNTNYIIEGKTRINKLEIPEKAIREALINAIAHRDYFSNGQIQVDIFYDRVEITNPGGLVSGLSKKDIDKKSMPRNPLLFDLMLRLDLGERVGSGITRIKQAMKEYNLKLKFNISKNWFDVIFYKPLQATFSESIDGTVNKNMIETAQKTTQKTTQKIIDLLTENSAYSIKELTALIGNITEDGIKYNLSKLKKEGIIKRVGPDKGGHWEIIKK